MRRLAFALTFVALLAVPATAAVARGGGWEPLPFPTLTVAACGTQVRIVAVQNKEFQKLTTDAAGVTHIKVSGVFKLRLTNLATGQSVLVNASGPSPLGSLAYPNGDFLFAGTGRTFLLLSPAQARATGLPQLAATSGPVRLLFHPNGGVRVLQLPHHVVDLCSQLT